LRRTPAFRRIFLGIFRRILLGAVTGAKGEPAAWRISIADSDPTKANGDGNAPSQPICHSGQMTQAGWAKDDGTDDISTDDTGTALPLLAQVSRVVSLVPSLTEALALSCPEKLVGATDWCTHPADLAVTRVRGTKNPDLEAIASLAPDLVVANREENRQVDLEALRAQGTAVWVTDIRTVDQALASIERLLVAVGEADTGWLDQARSSWAQMPTVVEGQRLRGLVPIWRRPWMYLGRDTYAGDVLRRLGVDNVLGEHPDRYPKLGPEQLPESDLVVLPDEPYLFTRSDGPEAFVGMPCALVSGRFLTWYGPAMVEAPQALLASLRAPFMPK
jgi:ABC-type Fe3+-hydroxamate transport system substrate-binding protein